MKPPEMDGGDEAHPSAERIEAAAFGWLAAAETEAVRAHAARCPRCRAALAAEEEVRDRLALLREAEARFEVVDATMRRIARERPSRRRWPALAVAAVVLLVALGGVILAGPGALEAATRWLQTIVVRPVPAPGQPGAPPATVAATAAAGGPIRSVDLAEAQRLAPFPVAPPRAAPAGFALAEVTLFQQPATAPPSRVFLTYRRPGAAQQLVITYQAAGAVSELPVATAATPQPLVVAGHRALYLDLAAEGTRPRDGGAPLQLGRLIVERPDVVLSATGDRRDGLDAAALAAILASVP